MKKMIIAAAATALAIGMGSTAFAFPWEDPDLPSIVPATANYSWVTGSFGAGTSAQDNYSDNNVSEYNTGSVSGSFSVQASNEMEGIHWDNNDDTWAFLDAEFEGSVAPDFAGAGGDLEIGARGYSGAFQDGADAYAVTFQESFVSTINDAHGQVSIDGGAFADFWKQQPGYDSGHYEKTSAKAGAWPW